MDEFRAGMERDLQKRLKAGVFTMGQADAAAYDLANNLTRTFFLSDEFMATGWSDKVDGCAGGLCYLGISGIAIEADDDSMLWGDCEDHDVCVDEAMCCATIYGTTDETSEQ